MFIGKRIKRRDAYEQTEKLFEFMLEQNNLPDSFLVDNVRFEIPCFTTPWGYPLRQQDGGILKEGMYVKIYYVSYKYENVIMKVEIQTN